MWWLHWFSSFRHFHFILTCVILEINTLPVPLWIRLLLHCTYRRQPWFSFATQAGLQTSPVKSDLLQLAISNLVFCVSQVIYYLDIGEFMPVAGLLWKPWQREEILTCLQVSLSYCLYPWGVTLSLATYFLCLLLNYILHFEPHPRRMKCEPNWLSITYVRASHILKRVRFHFSVRFRKDFQRIHTWAARDSLNENALDSLQNRTKTSTAYMWTHFKGIGYSLHA